MNPETVIPLKDLSVLTRIARGFGFEALEGDEDGLPVVTVTAPNSIMFMATIHNQCLKLIYQLKEDGRPGKMPFANRWNAMNYVGTAIPQPNGYILKHETLAEHGLVVGNVARTFTLFSEAVDKFLDSWFSAPTE